MIRIAGANTSAKRASDKMHGHVGEDFPFYLVSDDPSAEDLPTQKIGSFISIF